MIISLDLESTVTIHGFVDDDIQSIITGLDLVAMVTKTFEGFGLTIIEALNNDVPVLATRVGIVSELFPINSKMIVDVGDRKGIASAIEQFVSSEDKGSFIPEEVKSRLWRYDSNYMSLRYRQHLIFEVQKNSGQ